MSLLYGAPILQHIYPIRWTGTQHADELQLGILQLSVLLTLSLLNYFRKLYYSSLHGTTMCRSTQ